jgi:hypothetical protein
VAGAAVQRAAARNAGRQMPAQTRGAGLCLHQDTMLNPVA